MAAHVLALGVALLLYALPHHVIPHGENIVGVTSSRGSAEPQTAAAQATNLEQAIAEELSYDVEAPEEAATYDFVSAETAVPQAAQESQPEPQTAQVGDFRDALAGHFTSGDVVITDTGYQSANISVQMSREYMEDAKAWVYIADIYIADISCLTTAFSQDQYGRGYTEWIAKVVERLDAVIAINGDYYGTRDTGVVIRNGMLYRDNKTTNDIAILYWDGHMETFSPDAFDAVREMERGAYQSWCFGPMLLDETGTPLGIFNAGYSLIRKNPRTAIGYYEPGHYCFVTVDGRNDESVGATIPQLARLMQSHGCKLAFNLDGGQTSLMYAGSRMINNPSDGGRSSSDYILIVDRVTK